MNEGGPDPCSTFMVICAVRGMDILMSKVHVKAKKLSLEKRLGRVGVLFVLPFCLLYMTFQLFPIIYSFGLSFYSWNGIGDKTFVGFANYVKVFTRDPYFFKSLGNVLIIMAGYLPLTLVLGFLIAVLMYNKIFSKFAKLKSLFQTVQFLPYIIVPVACGLLYMLLFDWGTGVVNQILLGLGLVDERINWLGRPLTGRIVLMIMQVWRLAGYVMTIYLAGLANVSPDLIEAAQIDGANSRQVITRIMLPLLKNVTLFLGLTSIIDGIQMFDAPKILFTIGQNNAVVGGPERSCLTPVWYMYDASFGSSGSADLGMGAAISYGIFLFIVVISILSSRVMAGKGNGQ